MKKYYYIYKTTNIINGKFYIGMHSTYNLNDNYMGSGKRLRYSVNKHGKERFKIEILKFFNNQKELIANEEKIINNDLLKNPLCMNLRTGGTGGGGFTKEQSLKGTLAMLKVVWNNPEFRKRNSIRHSKRFKRLHQEGKMTYDKFRGKSHKKETKESIGKKNSIRQQGSKNSQFGTTWIYNLELQKSIPVKKEFIQDHLEQGWIVGRKIKF